jgi:toxin-antitoxin system PIN domain toxin
VARVALLDVNVIVALFDGDHVHHEAAHDWFADTRRLGWATTPITENGALRVLSNPAYHAAGISPTALRSHLQRFVAGEGHVFWPGDVSLLDTSVLTARATLTHRQLTDLWLLALAVRHGGSLATFDRTIPWSVVRGATRAHLQIIEA